MLVLGIDTASAATCVAIAEVSDGGPSVCFEQSEVAANRHGELLAPLISRALATISAGPSDLGGIVVGVGPGPYTGLRVGLVTAASMGYSLGVEAVGVCSLDAVAFASERPWEREFAVLSDARRKEVYWARYAAGQRLTDPAVSRPQDLADLPNVVVGAGAMLHRDQLPANVEVDETSPYPSAAALVRLGLEPGWQLPPRPLYLRRPDAQPPGRAKAVTPA